MYVALAPYQALGHSLPESLATGSFTTWVFDWWPMVENMDQKLQDLESTVNDLCWEKQNHLGLQGEDRYEKKMQTAVDTMHRLKIILNDRLQLRASIEVMNARWQSKLWEEEQPNAVEQLVNSKWLTNIVMSHRAFEELLVGLDVKQLREYGDIVVNIEPLNSFQIRGKTRRWDITSTYIGFIDIGLLSSKTTRRMHLRCANLPMDEEKGQGLAFQLTDVLERCLAHVRGLDVNRESVDRNLVDHLGATVQDAYDVSLWVGDLEDRQNYRDKKAFERAEKCARRK